jgi:hypothetical protein
LHATWTARHRDQAKVIQAELSADATLCRDVLNHLVIREVVDLNAPAAEQVRQVSARIQCDSMLLHVAGSG